MKNVAVIFGGVSVEHDVSVITGVLTLNSIDREKYNPIPIYIDKKGRWYSGETLFDIDEYKSLNFKRLNEVCFVSGYNILYRVASKKKGGKLTSPTPIAVCVNCLHGGGEDGSLAGLMKICRIPIASPNILSSAVAMDKGATKLFLKGLGLPFVKYYIYNSPLKPNENCKLKYPLIVKPISTGSSIGITTAKTRGELEYSISYALRFDNRVIVEEKVEDFIEINCSAYKNEKGEVIISECEKPNASGGILSFEDKYISGDREFPANIDRAISDKIKRITEKVYRALDFTGIIRIDFFVKEGEVIVNEINSVPGSLAYYLFADTLKEYTQILNSVILLAEREFARDCTVQREFNTDLLRINGAKGGKSKKQG